MPTQQLEHAGTVRHPLTDQLEEFGLAHEGLATVPVAAQEIGKLSAPRRVTMDSPAILQHLHLVHMLAGLAQDREQVVLEQVGRRQSHATRVQRLEHLSQALGSSVTLMTVKNSRSLGGFEQAGQRDAFIARLSARVVAHPAFDYHSKPCAGCAPRP